MRQCGKLWQAAAAEGSKWHVACGKRHVVRVSASVCVCVCVWKLCVLPARCVAFQLKITLAWLPPILPRTRGRATCTCMPAAAYPTKWRPGATINNNNILSLRNLFECKAYAAQAARSDCYLGHDAKIQRGKFVTQLTHTHAHTRTRSLKGGTHTYAKQSERVKFFI